MLKKGYIALHRKIVDWEWYKEPYTLLVFIHLILTANYEPKKFMGKTIAAGERVASYPTIAKELGLSVQNVRTAIKHLKLTHEVTYRTNHQYTVFTVVNYSLYQDKQQTNQRTPNRRLTDAQQTPNTNVIKINKDINKDKENTPALALEAQRDDSDEIFDFSDTGRIHFDNGGT